MKKSLCLVLPLLVLLLVSSAYGQSTNVCGQTQANAGGSFTWSSTYSVPIRVQPMPGTTWFLGQSYVTIPANGSVQINVPEGTTSGDYDLQTTFDIRAGGNPCGNTPGMPHIVVSP
jgi:hypothetical protein